MMKIRPCPVCQTPIIGRIDKKYCSDQCRTFANKENRTKNQQVLLDINQQLRKNRSILKTLCPQGKATVRKEVLISLGYQVNFFTSIFITQKKQVYYICYDFAYTPVMEGSIEKALIVNRQEYMKNLDPWKFLPRE